MQQPDDDDEHQRPGGIEDREDALAADEPPQLGEVAKRLPPTARPASASPTLAASTGSASVRSSQAPIRTSAWRRITSSRPNTSSAKVATTVSARRVSRCPLASTRSKIWSMYSGDASISRFRNRLSAATARSPRLVSRSAVSRADGCVFSPMGRLGSIPVVQRRPWPSRHLWRCCLPIVGPEG
jgi:hypothetical protein